MLRLEAPIGEGNSDEVVACAPRFDGFVATLEGVGLAQVERDQLDQLRGEGEQVLGRVAARSQLLVEGAREDADALRVIRRRGRRTRGGASFGELDGHCAPRRRLMV